MGYNCIRIERERTAYVVKVRDPEIEKANRASDKSDAPSAWKDPEVEYTFDDKAAVLAFLEKAMDIALPEDTYTSAFDKIAKAAGGTPDE